MLIILLAVWLAAYLVGKYSPIKNKLLAALCGFLVGLAAAFVQMYSSATSNERAGISIDPMVYMNGAFMTLVFAAVIFYYWAKGPGDAIKPGS